jgi:hypothetical protein
MRGQLRRHLASTAVAADRVSMADAALGEIRTPMALGPLDTAYGPTCLAFGTALDAARVRVADGMRVLCSSLAVLRAELSRTIESTEDSTLESTGIVSESPWYQGIPAIEDGERLVETIAKQEWVSPDLLERLTPPRDAFDGLMGDPGVVEVHAATWQAVSAELLLAHQDLAARIDSETAPLQAPAAQRYRADGHGVATLLAIASSAARAMSLIVAKSGAVVASVRDAARTMPGATSDPLEKRQASELVTRMPADLVEIAAYLDPVERLVDDAVAAWRLAQVGAA